MLVWKRIREGGQCVLRLATEAGKRAINISSPAHFAGMELSNLDVYLFALLAIYYKDKPGL
jgi:hypothetical protein